jgi:hypothetical protein
LKWVESILKLGLDAILLLDKKNADIESYLHGTKIQVDYIDEYRRGINQMDGRWSILEKYISSHPSIGAFFITDTGDVTVLKDPFVFIEHNKIYIGDEMINADCGFMAERVKAISKKSCTINYENGYKNKQLLNCGIFGGYREKPLEALRKSVAKLDWYDCPKECVDMVAFNEVLYSAGCYDNLIVHGKPLNTEFWKWDYNNTECYFQHK